MSDIITRLRQDEAIIAKLIMNEFRPLFAWALCAPGGDVGLESVLADTERHVILSVRSYLEWLAANAYRSGNFNPPWPDEPPDAAIKAMARKYLDSGEASHQKSVCQTIKWLRWRASDQRLPPLSTALGQFRDGQFFPDEAAIREWAAFYDWSK